LAEGRLERTTQQLAEARRDTARLQAQVDALLQRKEQAALARLRWFQDLHKRMEVHFSAFFETLVPGGEAALPLAQPASSIELPGLTVAVRFPQKPVIALDGLSGGQLAVLGLCLALAAFLEIPTPLVLDEVEPALDEALVRRLTRLLADIGQERQVLAVSHQTLMRHTAGHVMHIERNGGSRISMQYDPRLLRGPSSPGSR
jgi:chromosome segregation ATPase